MFQFVGWQFLWPVHFSLLKKDAFTNVFLQQVIINSDSKACNNIRVLRKQLLSDRRTVAAGNFGAGSRKGGELRRICDVVRLSTTGTKKGRFLYNVAQLYKPSTIIELGTSLGFGAMYMASGEPESRIFSVEGSRELHELAAKNIAELGFNNISLLNDTFDEAFPRLLQQNAGCDLLFIDGNHTKEATLQYFHLFLSFAKPGSIVVFDDIRWSQGMYEAWCEIRKHVSVKISVDLFSMGIVFFEKVDHKQHFRICY